MSRKKNMDTTETGGLRSKRTTESWSDISNAPLQAGDLLKIFNEATEVKRTFQIHSVVSNEDGTSRRINATVIDTTDHNEQIGSVVDFDLPRAQPILGSLIKTDEKFERLDIVQVNDLMAVELYKWLMSRSTSNFGAPFKACVQFLVTGGFLSADIDYKVAQNRLRAMIKQRGELFHSGGGRIFGTGIDLQSSTKQGMKLGQGIVMVKRVKLSKLFMGFRLMIESGLFGDFIIEE
jgi:hypothetical protein